MKHTTLPGLLIAGALLGGVPYAQADSVQTEQTSDTETPEITWLTINLETPGSLGVELLYKVDRLSDVTHLKVTGTLDAKDWTTLSNLISIVALDLSEADSSNANVPASAFQNRASLKGIQFPKGLTSIGAYAFNNSGIENIILPESIVALGDYVFASCRFLKSAEILGPCNIPFQGFVNNTQLETVKLGEGTTHIQSQAFSGCTTLKKINFPEGLQFIGNWAFNDTGALEDIKFPNTLSKIDDNAFRYCGVRRLEFGLNNVSMESYPFYHCNKLEEIILPAGKISYNYFCQQASNLKRIVCRAATPPSVSNSFNNATLANVTLVVPEFALVQYKLDSFWGRMGTISGGAESDRWIVASDLDLLAGHRMEGTPSVTIAANGKLRIFGEDAMPMENFTVFNNLTENTYGQLINAGALMTANSSEVKIYTAAGKWYFISLPFNVKMSDLSHSEGREFVVRRYDGEYRGEFGTGASWKDMGEDDVLEAGKGYIYQAQGAGYLDLHLSNEAITQLLSKSDRLTEVKAWESETPSNAGWNFIGNPYPSYYDMYAASITSPITVWDGSKYVAYSTTDDDVVLAPLQGFFMQQTEEDGEISFEASGRQLNTVINRAAKAKGVSNSSREIYNLSLRAASSEEADMTRLVNNSMASEEYEPSCDAPKFFGENPTALIYSLGINGVPMAINERPLEGEVIGLGCEFPADGEYCITATRANGAVELYDNLLNTMTILSEGDSYTFNANAGSDTNRFNVALHRGVESSVKEIEASNLKVVATATGLSIEAQAGAAVEVFDIAGIKKASLIMGGEAVTVEAEAGVYIVKSGNSSVKCIVIR